MTRLSEAVLYMNQSLALSGFGEQSVANRCLRVSTETLRILASEPKSPVYAYGLVRDFALDQSESTLASRVSLAPQTRPACTRGCGWCCYLRVSSTIPEVLWIAQHVAKMGRQARRDIARRCQIQAEATKGLDPLAYARLRRPCVMLRPQSAGHTCRIYQYRPLVCIAHESPSLKVCVNTWKDPDTDSSRPLSPAMETFGISSTLALIMWMQYGGPAEVELHSALATALTEPNAVRQWMAGEPIFEGARINPVEHESLVADHVRTLAEHSGLGFLCAPTKTIYLDHGTTR